MIQANFDVVQVWFLVSNQLRSIGMGDAISIDLNAIIGAMDEIEESNGEKLENRIDCIHKINYLFTEVKEMNEQEE